jgi:hypothetical protein
MLPAVLLVLGQNAAPSLQGGGLHGYINASVQTPPDEYRYGVSLYSSAWPLLERPVAGFQIGLASTWILPDNRAFKEPLVPHGTVARDRMPERGPSFWTVFQTIEGGLGFWVSNRYFAPTAKFRMNGSIDGYNHEVATSGWDFYGRPLPAEYMGIAQLSPRLLVPPDGVTLAANTLGELFGYAWMALPLVESREKPVKTGNQAWTLFVNSANFRGPVAFYIPSIWSKMSQNYPTAVGRGLDALPSIASSGAIEIGGVPQLVGATSGGTAYHRIPQLRFPVDEKGQTVLLHNMTSYSKQALWDEVEKWKNGARAPSGRFDAKGAFVSKLTANPLQVTQGGKLKAGGIANWVKTKSLDDTTFGLEWQPERLKPWTAKHRKGEFPSYFRHTGSAVDAVLESEVPDVALKAAKFDSPNTSQSYEPSDGGQGVWMKPGPRKGPYQARLADGSVVTYHWYRFIDQPAMQNAGLSPQEKNKLQALVEEMHRTWTQDKSYMAPPRFGRLASVDAAVLVKPPKGLEVGYVPVAIRQDPAK